MNSPSGAQMSGFVFCTAADIDYGAVGGLGALDVTYKFEGPSVEMYFTGKIAEFSVGEFYEMDLVIGHGTSAEDCDCLECDCKVGGTD